MTRNCYRCNSELEEPIKNNANYVRGEDTKETTEREVILENRHNDYTRAIRDRLMKVHNLNSAQANIVLSRNDEAYLQNDMSHDVSKADFSNKKTTDPSKPEDDPEVIRVDTQFEEVEEQRTGLVCSSCVKENDEIIW